MRHMILLMVLWYMWDIPVFFSVQYLVLLINKMQALFDGNTVLSLPSHGQNLENICKMFLTKNESVLFVLIGEKW